MRSTPSTPDHRRRARQIAAGLTILALFATACSGTSSSNSDGPAQATATTAVVLQPLEQPSSRCGTATTKATLVRFQAADGTSLNGVLVGRGPAGVVLVHQYPSDLCGFWPFADYLAKRGLRAFAIDLRCFGRSACPEGDAKGRVVDDLDAAVAELRRRGVTRVGLVGASMGGAAVLIAGTRVKPPVAAVVSLSGERDPTSLVGGISLDAGAAVDQLRVPTMFVVATNDRYVPVGETRAMYQAVKTRASAWRCSPATSMASMAGSCSGTQPLGSSSARSRPRWRRSSRPTPAADSSLPSRAAAGGSGVVSAAMAPE